VSLSGDLIEQAEHLAKREPKKPRQASLRRAVSSAYYAMFHMLIADGALTLIPNTPASLRHQAQRAFIHGEMKKACAQFVTSPATGIAADLINDPLEEEFNRVAAAFVELQEARHAADYDLSQTFDRVSVLQTINQAKSAMTDWKAVRKKPNANVFPAALLLHSRWNK
jgi:uncharacterized protein (UPF0332 family)